MGTRRHSEQAELARRIKEIKAQMRARANNRRKVDAPVETPLRLELRVAEAKLALLRAERRQSKHLLKDAQLKLQLAEQAQAAAGAERLPFPGESEAHPI